MLEFIKERDFMKKITIIAVIMLIFTLSACDSQQEIKREKLNPTDLSAVNIDGLVLGSFIDEIDVTKYTDASDRFEEKENTYFYDELSIKTDADGSIREIKGNVYSCDAEYGTVPFSVNGIDKPSSIDEVVKILGQNHK